MTPLLLLQPNVMGSKILENTFDPMSPLCTTLNKRLFDQVSIRTNVTQPGNQLMFIQKLHCDTACLPILLAKWVNC